MLLKGKEDDNLKWPMNLRHRLEILLQMQRGATDTNQVMEDKSNLIFIFIDCSSL